MWTVLGPHALCKNIQQAERRHVLLGRAVRLQWTAIHQHYQRPLVQRCRQEKKTGQEHDNRYVKINYDMSIHVILLILLVNLLLTTQILNNNLLNLPLQAQLQFLSMTSRRATWRRNGTPFYPLYLRLAPPTAVKTRQRSGSSAGSRRLTYFHLPTIRSFLM